jgi:hypothetical protein
MGTKGVRKICFKIGGQLIHAVDWLANDTNYQVVLRDLANMVALRREQD